MESQMNAPNDSNSVKNRLREFIEGTKENIESKSKQINSLVQSMKNENQRLVSKCNQF